MKTIINFERTLIACEKLFQKVKVSEISILEVIMHRWRQVEAQH